jgi:adenylate cyclase
MKRYRFDVVTKDQLPAKHEAACPVLLGKAPRASAERATITIAGDPSISREHLLVEEIGERRLRLTNRSTSVPLRLGNGTELGIDAVREVALPAIVSVNMTRIEIDLAPDDGGSFQRLDPAATMVPGRTVAALGASPPPEVLAGWIEGLIGILSEAEDSDDFHRRAARLVVEQVGLDVGLVLVHRSGNWDEVARYTGTTTGDEPSLRSASVLREVLQTGQAVYETHKIARPTESLRAIDAVVAAPWLDRRDHRVLGVVYGARRRRNDGAAAGISPIEARIVQTLATVVAARRAHHKARSALERVTSPDLASMLTEDPAALDVGTREITVLASDLRDSSRLAGQMGEGYFALSRDVMDHLTARIDEHGGTVVDYAGDGILAMWNAPGEQPDHAARACRAALAMQGEIGGLNATWAKRIGEPLRLGIGITTGRTTIGNAGSRIKIKYGPVGKPVNVASRIEGATKHLGVPILIGDATRQIVGDRFPTRRLCEIQLAGIDEPVTVHELYCGSVDKDWEKLRAGYQAALEEFEARDWLKAFNSLKGLVDSFDTKSRPHDFPTLALLGRVVEGLKSPGDKAPAKVWSFGAK